MTDEETGFYYLQSRYYNPEVGRFISADVLLSTGQGVLGHNAYAYCLNSPIIRVDLDGDFGGLILGAIVGAVVNAAVNIASTIASNAIDKGNDLKPAEIITVGLLGAAEGALSVLCPGASVIIGASFGAANSIASGIIRGEPFGSIVGDTIISVGFGALGGAMSGGDTINTRLLDKGLDARKLLKKSAAKKLTKCAQNAAAAAKKRATVYLLKNIFSLLIWEIPIVLLFLMIYPKSPDKAIEMQVPGYAIILYDPPYVYTTNHGKKFLINGEEYTVTTNYKGNIYKLFSMLQKEDTVKIKYFWIGGGKCIVDIRSDSTIYADYNKDCSGKKIFAFVFCGLAQLAFGIIQSWTLQDIYLDFLDLKDAD